MASLEEYVYNTCSCSKVRQRRIATDYVSGKSNEETEIEALLCPGHAR